jgi:hypothetical protein
MAKMKIELVYRSLDDRPLVDKTMRKWLVIPNDTDISEILNPFHAKGLAIWQDDWLGGKAVNDYRNSGPLDDGVSYCILSKDIPETINALDQLKETASLS